MTTFRSDVTHVGIDLGRETGIVVWKEGIPLPTLTIPVSMQGPEPSIYAKFGERLDNLMKALMQDTAVDAVHVTYEYVAFMKSRAATNIWSGLRGVMMLVIDQYPDMIQVENPVHVGTLKKFATTNGKATKTQMRKAMAEFCPDFPLLDNDNVVDAGWLTLKGMHLRKGRDE